ncbi:MAG: hypothetical protein JRJ57_00835 [Deltaproteobacteria bacterium]|nr:hypothetical protein [Deltaproteobacteria bacterium]
MGYFDSNLIGPVNVSDAFFGIMTIAYFVRIKKGKVKCDRKFLLFFRYCVFLIVYFIISYGYIIPVLNGNDTFRLFLLKERNTLYGIFILWFVYYFANHGLIVHYKILVYTAAVVLSMYLLGLVFGGYIVPITSFSRYVGEDVMRIGMLSYGLFQAVLPLSLVVLMINPHLRKIPVRKLLYFASLLLVIVYLLTLTRRTYINLIATIVFAVFVINKVIHIRKGIRRLIIALGFVFVVLTFLFPDYRKYSGDLYRDVYLLLSTGEDTRGRSDYRLSRTGDMEIVKDYIREKPWFGQGFTWMNWDEKVERANKGDRFARAWDAAQEVPVYYMVFSKGIIGLLVYTPVYIIIIYSLVSMYRKIRKYNLSLFQNHQIVLLFSLFLIVSYILEFTVKAYSLYGDVGSPRFMVNAGLMFSILAYLNKEYEIEKDPDTSTSYR